MEDYTILGRIGEGAHGIVMKGRHRKTGTIVALKKVLLKRLEDGLPETALREIKALQVQYYFIIIILEYFKATFSLTWSFGKSILVLLHTMKSKSHYQYANIKSHKHGVFEKNLANFV